MLKKANRLTKQKDFDLVLKQGQGIKNRVCFIKFKANQVGVTRFGFIVSKKIAKSAVKRNKIKRRLRHIVKENQNFFKQGVDIAFLPNLNVLEIDFAILKQEVEKTLKQAGLL